MHGLAKTVLLGVSLVLAGTMVSPVAEQNVLLARSTGPAGMSGPVQGFGVSSAQSRDSFMHVGAIGTQTPHRRADRERVDGTALLSVNADHGPAGHPGARSQRSVRAENDSLVLFPDDVVTVKFTVTPMRILMHKTLWAAGSVDVTLTSPTGEVFSAVSGQAGLVYESSPTFSRFAIEDPEPGEWTVTYVAAYVSSEGTAVLGQRASEPYPNERPIAAFSMSRTGNTVEVDASGSTDPDGDVVGYFWDFGDGTIAETQTAVHTYDQPGYYRVTLEVTDDSGETAYASSDEEIVITEAAVGTEFPSGTEPLPTAAFSFAGFSEGSSTAELRDTATTGAYISVAFDLGGDHGDAILSTVGPRVRQTDCSSGNPVGAPRTARGAWIDSPRYSPELQKYVWTWRTDHSWAATCQELFFPFSDGSVASHTVAFRETPWWLGVLYTARDRAVDHWSA